MNEWRELTQQLVELDLTIEDLGSWATAPEDVAELRRREQLRDDIQLALRFHHVPRRLRRQLDEHAPVKLPVVDPRD